MTRMVGVLLLVGAAVVLLLGGIWLAATAGSTGAGGTILGFGLLVIFVVMPMIVGGILVLTRSKGEAAEEYEAENLRKILDMVKTRGAVDISDVIIELKSDREKVQDMIYRLVGMGVFSGYVNWDDGILYSSEAAALHDLQQCKKCGGKVSFEGKGVLQCSYCGTEYFLAK